MKLYTKIINLVLISSFITGCTLIPNKTEDQASNTTATDKFDFIQDIDENEFDNVADDNAFTDEDFSQISESLNDTFSDDWMIDDNCYDNDTDNDPPYSYDSDSEDDDEELNESGSNDDLSSEKMVSISLTDFLDNQKNVVEFGTYEQDGNLDNGAEPSNGLKSIRLMDPKHSM